MGDAASHAAKAEKEWWRAIKLLNIYYYDKDKEERDKAEEIIRKEYRRSPRDLENFMYS